MTPAEEDVSKSTSAPQQRSAQRAPARPHLPAAIWRYEYLFQLPLRISRSFFPALTSEIRINEAASSTYGQNHLGDCNVQAQGTDKAALRLLCCVCPRAHVHPTHLSDELTDQRAQLSDFRPRAQLPKYHDTACLSSRKSASSTWFANVDNVCIVRRSDRVCGTGGNRYGVGATPSATRFMQV